MTDAAPVRLAAVVVTYNRRVHIETTVARLLAEPVDRILVVDNGSDDGSRDWLAGVDDARLEVLLPKENLGGAGGFELGLRHVMESYDPDWVVVMDDDARPEPGALAAFRRLDLDGWDGVAASVRYPDGRVCDMNRPGLNPFWHLTVFFRTMLGGGRMGFHMRDADYRASAPPRRVDVASFVGLFLSRAAIARAGYPDGRLFLYADDTLYTLRLTHTGGRIGFFPTLGFEHDCSTLGPGEARIFAPLWKAYYTYRNGLLMYRYAAGWYFWPLLPILLVKWLWRGRLYGDSRRRYFRLLWRAVRDALRRRLHRLQPAEHAD